MKLLTIAIPTYNRSEFLYSTLKSVEMQMSNAGLNKYIDVLVSDNCSEDDTEMICSKFKNVLYFRNDENLGMDGNFHICVERAKSKYVWILGDDENLFPWALSYIVSSLLSQSPGCMFVRPSIDAKAAKLFDATICSVSKEQYISRVSIYLSFISSNIVRRDLVIDDNESRIKNTKGGFLYVLQLYLDCLHRSDKQIILNKPVMINGVDRTAGYGFYTVFGRNFLNILNAHDIATDELYKNIKVDIYVRMLLPMTLKLDQKNKDLKFKDENLNVLHVHYGKFPVKVIKKSLEGNFMYKLLAKCIHRFVGKILRIKFNSVA